MATTLQYRSNETELSTIGAAEEPTEEEWTFQENTLQAWLCLLGSFLLMFPTFGFQTSIGSVQNYIAQHQLASYGTSEIGWISSVLVYLTLFLGVQVGPLFDRYGPLPLLVCGSLLTVATYLGLGQCQTYWQFMLCLGVLGGIASAIVTTVAISVISHWFHSRRGLASGFCLAGSSAGGVVIPLTLPNLLLQIGWTWTMRAFALMAGVCLFIGTIFVSNKPESLGQGSANLGSRQRQHMRRATIDLNAFRTAKFTFLAIAVFGFELIIFGCAALLPTYARYAGFKSSIQFDILPVVNGSSLIGRIFPGLLADRFGRFNTVLALVLATLVVMLAVWLPFATQSSGALMTAAALFGLASGGWLSLAPVCAGQLCRTEEYGRYYGTVYSLAAFGVLIAAPLGGEVLQSAGPRAMLLLYAGVLIFAGASFAASRWALLSWKWSWKIKI